MQYLEPTYSQELGRPVIAEPISEERYQWIQANLPKLKNNHNPDLSDSQLEYLHAVKQAWPGKDFTRGIKVPENAPETSTEHLTHPGVYQSRDSALPAGDRD